jgi:hypothetical protein
MFAQAPRAVASELATKWHRVIRPKPSKLAGSAYWQRQHCPDLPVLMSGTLTTSGSNNGDSSMVDDSGSNQWYAAPRRILTRAPKGYLSTPHRVTHGSWRTVVAGPVRSVRCGNLEFCLLSRASQKWYCLVVFTSLLVLTSSEPFHGHLSRHLI